MSSFAGLSIGVSGLHSAQAGLYVAGHNMGNTNTEGFSRQRVLQHEFIYRNIGSSPNGVLQLGLGSDVTSIRRLRDAFLDISYRGESGKNSYYAVKAQAGEEAEAIVGELQGSYNTQTVLNDLWSALNELSVYQPGLETRGNFISTSVTFIDKANNVYDRLFNYQHNLDQQIRDGVVKVNQLVEKIAKYNDLIVQSEASGDNANDFRDERDLALDELSSFVKIEYKEAVNGRIDIIAEDRDLLLNNDINKLGLKYTTQDYGFVEPVLTGVQRQDILPFDAPPTSYQTLYDLTGEVSSAKENDYGGLKGMMVARGYYPVNYSTNPVVPDPSAYVGGVADPQYAIDYSQYEKELFNVSQAFVPRAQKEIDTIVHSIVTVINDATSPYTGAVGSQVKDPNAPLGLNKLPFYEGVFVRKYVDRFTSDDFNPEDPENYHSLYTIGNMEINPNLLNTDGYNKIALSKNGDVENTEIVLDLMETWKNPFIDFAGANPLNVDDAYKQFVGNIATQTREAGNFNNEQTTLLTQIVNKRSENSGVSLDEEMTNMLKYQHAYNSSARVINTIDSMIDRIINKTGRAGI